VQVGIEGSKLAQITSGLQPGERVILGGQEKYQEGEEVNAAIEPEPASETEQETGGTIDLKADKQDSNEAAPNAPTENPNARKAPGKSSSGGTR